MNRKRFNQRRRKEQINIWLLIWIKSWLMQKRGITKHKKRSIFKDAGTSLSSQFYFKSSCSKTLKIVQRKNSSCIMAIQWVISSLNFHRTLTIHIHFQRKFLLLLSLSTLLYPSGCFDLDGLLNTFKEKGFQDGIQKAVDELTTREVIQEALIKVLEKTKSEKNVISQITHYWCRSSKN